MSKEPNLCATVIKELVSLITAARGLEIAGLLLENDRGEQRIQRAPNLHCESGHIEIPRWWLEKMLERQDRSGFRPVAFFHSHTSSLELSETDQVSLRNFPLPWAVLMVSNCKLNWAVYSDTADH